MLRSIAPSSTQAASYLPPSSAVFITTIAESSFQYTQAAELLLAEADVDVFSRQVELALFYDAKLDLGAHA